MIDISTVAAADPELAKSISDEIRRQRDHIELIASENFVSPAVLAAMGSPLTNKYAEGYPGKRYYGGCEFVDVAEELARKRACEIFGAEHANVQPHSGCQANFSVYFALIKPGDKIMGMSLDHGGHLTHGSPVSIAGKYFNIVSYQVDKDTETINFDELRRLAVENKPNLIIAGASAYPRTLDFAAFREIADEVGAYLMVDMAHIAGLVAAGLHPNPMPYADVVTTTTHKTLRGPRGGMILCKEKYAKAIDSAVFPGIQGGPLMHVIAAKAVAFKEAQTEAFMEYQHRIIKNAKALAQGLTKGGLRLVSGGTDNHMMLVDLRNTGRTGKEVEKLLDAANITANKNAIPFDPASRFVTSGLRFGTPAVTTRGMDEKDMAEIAGLVCDVAMNGEEAVARVKARVLSLTERFPLYANDVM